MTKKNTGTKMPKKSTSAKPQKAVQKKALVQRLTVALNAAKKKKQREESKTRNEFRYNPNTEHPNYIFEVDKKKDAWRAIGITHEPETFGIQNAPLKVNPKKKDARESYMRNGIVAGSHYDFSKKPMKNMRFSDEDMPNVKAKVRNDKKKRKKSTKK